MMYKVILFTHDDLDGAGCRIIFELAHNYLSKSDYKVLNCSNGAVDSIVMDTIEKDDVDENTIICFGDICASREVLEILVSKFKNVYVWDHHVTSGYAGEVIDSDKCTIIPENTLGIKECGTSLMYQYYSQAAFDQYNAMGSIDSINQEAIAKFVDTVRSYDTFEFKETNNIDAKRLRIFFSLIGMERFCERYIHVFTAGKCSPNEVIFAADDVKFIIDSKIDNEIGIINNITPENVITTTVRGYKTALVFPIFGATISELGWQFLHKYPDYQIFAQFTLSNGAGTFSFRSRKGEINAGIEIAEPIGGGGHPEAAGAAIPKFLYDQFINELDKFLNGIS